MSAVEFGDLPPDKRGGYEWDVIAEELKANPAAWAKVRTGENKQKASNYAHQIRIGGRVPFRPAGQFEATVRGLDVWARYIGGDPS